MKTFFKKAVSIAVTAVMTASLLTSGLAVFADEIQDNPMGNAEESLIKEQNEVNIPATQVKLDCNYIELDVGDKFMLTYKLKPKNSDDIVTFKSRDKNIATVDENGLVKVVGYGTVKIVATASSGRKMNCVVAVKKNPNDIDDSQYDESIVLYENGALMKVGKTTQIETQVPADVKSTLKFTSANKNIATVDSNGNVKAVGTGTTYIQIKASNGWSNKFYIRVYNNVFNGIDVSKWQGNIDWSKVKSDGIDYAMIRSSYGTENVDQKLAQNVKGCIQNDIPYGFYHYTYAKNVTEAKAEAEFFLNTISGYSPEYPVVLDIEENFYKQMSKKQVTDIIVAFTDVLEQNGYYVSLYTNTYFLNNYVDKTRITDIDIWISCWGDFDRLVGYYKGSYGMWQYSAKGKVSGISGDVDKNYAFKDYKTIIKKNNLNK